MSSTRRFAPVFAAALALVSGACASQGDGGRAAAPPLPTEQFKIAVEQTPDQLALAPHANGLSANQSAALGDFTMRWREAGGGEVAIRAPDKGDAVAVSRATAAAQDALEGLGVPRQLMRVEGYVADAGATPAPLLVSFQRYTAKGPDCSSGWDNLLNTGSNKPSAHFGCAVTANFAAQIANPRDLLQPSPSMASDPTRRETVLQNYRKGEVTSTKADGQASGAVSSVVQ